jgi:hypothetical protein
MQQLPVCGSRGEKNEENMLDHIMRRAYIFCEYDT